METHDSADYGLQTKGQETSRKGHRKRNKVSNLHARLCPNFDLRDTLIPEKDNPYANTYLQRHSQEELDPKTMDFATLVTFLHPTFIKDYLRKILNFFKTNLCEMSFPNIAPHKEEFLVRIAKDNVFLKCSNFTAECQRTGQEILMILHQNRHYYKWEYYYGGGICLDNVLVYKKQLLDQTKNPQETNSLSKCMSSTPQTLASTLEDLTLERQDIPTSFKIQMLNTTLKFIKDNTRLTLQYPIMPYHQAAYVFFLIQSGYKKDTSIGFGFKSLYSAFYEAMSVASARFEFNVEFFESNNCTAGVVLQKTSKAIIENNCKSVDVKLSTISNSTTSSDSLQECIKAEKDFQAKRKLIQSLSETFIKASLTEVLNFLEDEQRASLEFKHITASDSRFLQLVTTLARDKEYHRLFHEDVAAILKEIALSRRKKDYTLSTDVGKVDKWTLLRDLLMYKTPIYRRSETPRTPSSKRCENSQLPISSTTNKEDNSRTVQCKNKTNNLETNICNSESKDVASVQSIEVTIISNARKVNSVTTGDGTRSLNKDTRPPIKKGIAFQSAGVQVVDTMHAQVEQCVEISRLTGSTRKNRLIEAMSTPMESGIAERMMRRMGWEGGALGIRGEGLTEPLMPPLHISPGAGLGHVKTKLPSRSAAGFRIIFLQHLLSWILTGGREKTIKIGPMTKREAKFVKPTLRSLNDRKNVVFANNEEVALVNKVLNALEQDPEFFIECQISEDKSEITLIRNKFPNEQSSKKKKKKSKQKDSSHSKKSHYMDEESEIKEQLKLINGSWKLARCCPSSKAARSLAYRLLFMQKIKGFCENDEPVQELNFNTVLNTKQRTYIQGIVTNINKREVKNVYNSFLENNLFKEIRKVSDFCYVSVVFSGQKIILQKKYYQKSFTNLDTELPPTKTNKSTIVYANNIPTQDINIKNDSDNDVIMVNDNINIDRDIIVISDDNDSLADITTTACDAKAIGMETDCDSKDMSIDLSNESIFSLNVLENNIKKNCDLEKYITELEDVLNAEVQENALKIAFNGNRANNNTYMNEVNNRDELNLIHNCSISSNKIDLNLTFTKDIDVDFKKRVVNNSHVNTELNYEKNDVTTQNDIQNHFDINDKTTDVNKHVEVISPCSDVNKEFYKSLSVCSSKRSRSDSENSDIVNKKYKGSIIKRVSVVPENSDDKITIGLAKKVQILISTAIDNASFLPLLQCHGIQKNSLVYSCHNEKTYLWLKKVIDVASVLKVKIVDVEVEDENYYKLKMKMNSFIEENFSKFLNRIELYNAGLITDKWKFVNRQVFQNFVIITLWVDRDSFQYICDSNFSLFAGIDKIQFCICFSTS